MTKLIKLTALLLATFTTACAAPPKRIAAIVTEYRHNSHADVIVSRLMLTDTLDGKGKLPNLKLVSLYTDQVPKNDTSRKWSKQFKVPIYKTVEESLTLGTGKLAVDGVLLIAEHGVYPKNATGNTIYPKRRLFNEVQKVFRKTGQSVPVFVDKHLADNWKDSKWLYDTAAELKVPLMAGSSLPVCWRNPWLEHDIDSKIDEALAIGFSGLEIYGFHTLEVLQCMVERRAGGETGVAAVTCLEGDDVWKAAEQGAWSRELAEAACAAIENKPTGRIEDHCSQPAIALIEYRDGLRGAALMLDGYVEDLAYAARVGDGEVVATEFFAQGHGGEDEDGPYAHFAYLSLNVEEMFLTGRSTVPVERTLLTTGVLETMLDSRHAGHQRLETPWLDITYQCRTPAPWRPTAPRPTGACLDPWPPV